MKKTKLKVFLSITVIGICALSGSILVSASKARESEHVIKSIMIDPNGNKIVTYDEELYVDDADEEGVSATAVAVPIDEDSETRITE